MKVRSKSRSLGLTLGLVWLGRVWFGHTKLGPCLIEPVVGFKRRVTCSSRQGRGRQ